MNLQVGSKVIYAEIKEGQYTKRFVFPVEASLEDKISLLSEHAPVSIQHLGTGEIISQIVDGANGVTNSLNSVPSGVNALYEVRFDNHPDISSGKARYSQELCDYIAELESKNKQNLPEPPPEKPKFLTEKLREQIKTTSSVNSDEIPGQMTLDDFLQQEKNKLPSLEEKLAEVRKQKGMNRLLSVSMQEKAQPLSSASTLFVITKESNQKIDNIWHAVQSIRRMLASELGEEDSPITGRELARWFTEYSYEHGADKAWDYIASRIQYWE